jgi:hypothetical protein
MGSLGPVDALKDIYLSYVTRQMLGRTLPSFN